MGPYHVGHVTLTRLDKLCSTPPKDLISLHQSFDISLGIMANVRKVKSLIHLRIENFDIVLRKSPTPLLTKEAQHARDLHRKALDDPIGPHSYLKDIDDLHEKFETHWRKAFGSYITFAYLVKDILLWEQFVIAKLLEDYSEEHCSFNPLIHKYAEFVIQKDDREDNTMYQKHVVFPLEEMMLSRDWMEKKIRTVVNLPKYPGGEIQRLINRCDWSNLAEALTEDRDVVLKVFGNLGFDKNIPLDQEKGEGILQSINEVERKYFSSLSGSSTFELSAYAMKISTKQTYDHHSHISQSPWTIASGCDAGTSPTTIEYNDAVPLVRKVGRKAE